jgi:hypothetical protein
METLHFLVYVTALCADLKSIEIKGSNSRYENQFFESQPRAGFQKTDFVVSSAKGAGNNKIGFVMRIVSKKLIVFFVQLRLHCLTKLSLIKTT